MNNELENVKIDLNDEMAMEEVLRIVKKDERLALPVVKALSYLPQANEAIAFKHGSKSLSTPCSKTHLRFSSLSASK